VDDDVIAVGEKVILRKKRIEDAVDDHGWRQDPELAELDAAAVLRQSLKDFRRDLEHELNTPTPWVKRYGVETLDGLHIGNCMVYDLDTVTGQGELGILLGNRDYWGGGYGREAMKLLIAQCFQMPSIKRLYLHTLSWNARARAAFAGCGLRDMGPDRRGGKDFVLMEISRSDWEGIQAGNSA
jgi:RimJ/RimL family protein N-acetyltransferase